MHEFQRGAIRLHILHYADQADIDGALVTCKLAAVGYRISPGTLYPTLHRMERDGWLASRRLVVGGRTRRIYSITEAGQLVLEESRKALAALASEVLGLS